MDLFPSQPADDDQAVEGIHLRLSAPHRAERVTDRPRDPFEVEHRSAGVEDAEVVDEHPSFALEMDRDLLDDPKAE